MVSTNAAWYRYWRTILLTQSGRPVLLEHEVELMICQNVSIYLGDTKVHRAGTATLTTHRLIWIGTDKTSFGLPLEMVLRIDTKAGFIGLSSPKLTIHLADRIPDPPTTRPMSIDDIKRLPLEKPPSPGYTHLSFHGEGRDAFTTKMGEALRGKAWTILYKPAVAVKKEFTTSAAGISGIMRGVKEKERAADRTLEEAFTDLSALMRNAQEIVSLAARFTATKDSDGKDNKEKDAFQSMLVDMGIPSPVTRQSAGAAYHVQLARQLADFIRLPLHQSAGMMTLTDVYCIFNRARGTELISPEDLLHACELFTQLRLPLRLRRFDTGVLVLQSDAQNDAALAEKILKVIRDSGTGITALDLTTLLPMSIALANQQLLYAEQQQLLCRDDTIEALRFYPNIFITAATDWTAIISHGAAVAAADAANSSATAAASLPTATIVAPAAPATMTCASATPTSSSSSSSSSSFGPPAIPARPTGRVNISAKRPTGRIAMDEDEDKDDDSDDGTGRPSPRDRNNDDDPADADDIDFVVVPSANSSSSRNAVAVTPKHR